MSGEVPSATTPLKLYELECTGGVWATYKRRDVHAPQAGGAVDYVKLCEIIAASKHCDPDILMLFDGSITCDPNLPEAVHACLKDDFVPVRNAITFYVKPPVAATGEDLQQARKRWEIPTAQQRDEIVAALRRDSDSSRWTRPTPRPAKLIGRDKEEWSIGFPVDGPIPLMSVLDDGRTQAIGVGNAYGTGKTELAINGAEKTVAAEPGVSVAYMAFGNGYSNAAMPTAVETLPRESRVLVYLYAALHSTRVVDVVDENGMVGGKEVQCHINLFSSILSKFTCSDRPLPPPTVNDFAKMRILFIVDEVQRIGDEALALIFSWAALVCSRGVLLVGAFCPQITFPSGNRCVPLAMHTLTAAETNEVMKLQGINTSELLPSRIPIPVFAEGMVRFGAMNKSASTHITSMTAAIECFFTQNYRQMKGLNINPRVYVAAVADAETPLTNLQLALSAFPGGQGAAFISFRGPMCRVRLPPVAIATTHQQDLIELCALGPDSCPTCHQNAVNEALREFVKSGWIAFETISGLALALRVAALSSEDFDFRDDAVNSISSSVLTFVFRKCFATALFRTTVESFRVRKNCRVAVVATSPTVDLEELQRLHRGNVILVPMRDVAGAEFDHYILVPHENQLTYLTICVDAKDTSATNPGYFNEDTIRTKVAHFENPSSIKIPQPAVAFIISNRKASSDVRDAALDNSKATPFAFCDADTIESVVGRTLLMPKDVQRK